MAHWKATDLVLSDAYRRKHSTENPNLAPLQALSEMGVEVHVCGHALAAQKISTEEVSSTVVVDLSALISLATLQLNGWAVVNE